MMARHLTRNELINQQKRLAELKKTKYSAPFSAMAITWNYILWTELKFRAERIGRFNQRVSDYLASHSMDDCEDLQERLYSKAKFKIEYVEAKFNKSKKKSYSQQVIAEEMQLQNSINQYSTLYTLCAFNAMIDEGYGEKRLDALSGLISEFLAKIDRDEIDTMTVHAELASNGVIIELPKVG